MDPACADTSAVPTEKAGLASARAGGCAAPAALSEAVPLPYCSTELTASLLGAYSLRADGCRRISGPTPYPAASIVDDDFPFSLGGLPSATLEVGVG